MQNLLDMPFQCDGSRSSRPKVIDLFAGVGGLSLGALRAGFDIALAVENDKHASAAHRVNFPNIRHSEADISQATAADLLIAAELKAGELGGLIGGPPCQGFSAIGKRNIADSRNSLFRKFFELAAQCQPGFFVAENVLGVLDEQYDNIREEALALVRDTYIVLEPQRFKACDFGAPTVRERVFFVGYRRESAHSLTTAEFEAEKVSKHTLVRDALAGLPTIRRDWLTVEQGFRCAAPLSKSKYGRYISGHVPNGAGDEEALRLYREHNLVSGCLGTRHTNKVKARYASLRPGEQDQISKSVRLKADGLCPTLRAGTASDKGSYQAVRPIHPTSPRVITPREAARLQGFPDWFQFAPSKWHSFRQIGNSVSPFVAEAVLSVIKNRFYE